jgi:arginase
MNDNLSFYERRNASEMREQSFRISEQRSSKASAYENSKDSPAVSIVSVPIELGSDERGLAAAPEHLFSHGLEKMLASLGREVAGKSTVQCKNAARVATAGAMKHVREIADVAKRSATAVEKAARTGNTVLALGGDHSMAIGTLAGAAAAYPSLGVVYIDAHPDCNTDETTITGNVHGMVVSALMGHGHSILTKIPKRFIAPQDFLFIGLKDFDQKEIEFLREHKISSYTMLDIAKRGLSPAISAIDALSRRVDAVWISMDMDSIDRQYAPGVGMPNDGGLTRREALALAHHIGKTCRVAGIDLVEMVPAKDTEGKTAGLALELLARFLGGEYSWYQQQYINTYRETNVTKASPRVRVKRAQARAR